jgi:uncharacterized protein YjbI with pentapeptide repeats
MSSESSLWLPPLSPKEQQHIDRQHKRQQRNLFAWTGLQGKTLWDYLQLLAVLALPVVVAVGTLWFSAAQSQASFLVAQDQQQETALQNYLDHMSDLLLNNNLRLSKPGDEVRNVARTRTLSVLPQLNGTRKREVINFLYEAGLIDIQSGAVINLATADLSHADLSNVDLSESDLGGANLSHTNLSKANLIDTNLGGANLNSADLSGASLGTALLNNANLSSANLVSAKLNGTNLSSANLVSANLSKADLGEANLSVANLSHTDLSNADLSHAILIYAILNYTNLNYAILNYADLSHTDLSKADLSHASLRGTRMPDESMHP